MRLPDLLAVLSEAKILNQVTGAEVLGVTCDSRAVQLGYVFVAIRGALTDGHLYIEEALDKGALAVILERPQGLSATEVKVPVARRALAELSRAFYGYPDRELFMVGVTATNGKTTTTSLVHHILTGQEIRTAVIGSVAYRYGEVKTQASLTTPESSELHAMLRQQVEAGVKVVSMEVSSIAEEQYRVYGIDYDVVAFLNITPDHMPDHGSFEAYYQAKAKLIRTVAPGTPVILNRDQEEVYRLREETAGQVISMGIDHTDADVGAENLRLPGGIPHFDLVIRRPLKTRRGVVEPGRWPVRLKVPGRHTVYNALAATIIALCYVIPIEEIVLLLESFKGVERRLQILYQKEFTLIDDHISDEDNTRKMLEALVLITAGLPVHVIYAVRGNRGVQVNREVIAQFAKYRESINWKNFIVTDSVDVARKRDMVLPEEGQAVLEDLKAAGYEVEYQAELRPAIEKLMPLVGEGEFFVLAGSHNMDKGGRIALELLAEGRAESEREAILEILEDRVMG